MKTKKAATLIECGPMGIMSHHIYIHSQHVCSITYEPYIWFTKGNKRKQELKVMKKNYLLVEGHKDIKYPLPYTEEDCTGFRVQKSRFCMYDPRYAEEYKEWAKSFDRSGLNILAEG